MKPAIERALTEGLNPEQRAVVMAPTGQARLVVAGPGSGKTRTITHRVARLIADGVPPQRILLLTFTNRAAREMMSRCEQLCGSRARDIVGGTFHGIGARILRQFGPALGLDPEFHILDRDDTEEQMRAALGDLGLGLKQLGLSRIRGLLRIFSTAVQREMSIAETLQETAPHLLPMRPQIEAVGARFVERKQASSLLDFDDLLVGWSLLADPPHDADPALLAASAQLRQQFVEVLVDEVQDTNPVQMRIVEAMVAASGSITVVGDDCQGIYGFRGADPQHMLGFERRFVGAERQLLTINYRATPELVNLANRSIAHNVDRLEKDLRAARPSAGLPPWVVRVTDRQEEARFVVAKLRELQASGVPLQQMAVLYRAHAQSTDLQVAMSKAGLPYQVRSGLRFFEQAHIKDVLAWLRAIGGDELAFRRVLRLYPGVGAKGASLAVEAVYGGLPLHEIGAVGAGRTRVGLAAAASIFAQLSEPGLGPAALIERVCRHYKAQFISRFDDAAERAEELDELIRFAEGFDSVSAMLGDLPVASGPGQSAADEAVVLSSIHGSKGLEWQHVFLIGCTEGRLPHGAAYDRIGGVDEERRLFYVAITRAADGLVMTTPQRAGRGQPCAPSRFLTELLDEGEPPFVMLRPEFDAPA